MMKERSKNSPSQLPNAPLVEVVFEVHWKLEGDSSTPPPLQSDPGYSVLADNFVSEASKHGFRLIKKMGAEGMLPAHSVGLRLYKDENQSFPLWQIGPGIFASNESAAYEWQAFKKLALDGVKALLSSYPKMKSFALTPNRLELRYIDSFDNSIAAHQNAVKFINEETSLNIDIPPFLSKKPFGNSLTVNLLFDLPVKNMKDTHFNMRIANGRADEKETIILESKVFTKSDAINMGKTQVTRIKYIESWLERAHNITSPFFKQFASGTLMDQFRGNTNASN